MTEENIYTGSLAPLSLYWYWILGLVLLPLLGFGLLIIAWGLVKMRSRKYEITSERLRVTKGFFSHTVKEADLDKVQDVTVAQGFVGRILNFGTLFFNTAGSSGYEIVFYNVEDPKGLKEKFRGARKKTA